MDRKFVSILESLDYVPVANLDLMIESKAQATIASFSNLIELIAESYDSETAADLTKRLFNAARTGDEEKFRRKIRAIRESKTRKNRGYDV